MEIRILQGCLSKRLKNAALLGVLCSAMACGPEPLLPDEATDENAAGELGTSEQPLGSGAWINGWSPLSHEDGSPVIAEGKFTACETRYGTAGGHALFKKDASNRIVMTRKSYSPFPSWLTIGSSNFLFSTEPTCASLDGPYDPNVTRNKQIAIVAKGNGASNRYWIATWKQGDIGPFGVPPTAGQLVRDWHLVSTDSYASGPAATVHNGKLLVAGTRSSDNRLVVRSYPLNLTAAAVADPYTSGGPWTATTLPALPTGWTMQGDPAITHAPAAFSAMILVRATSGSSYRLYRSMTSNGTSFTAWANVPTGLGSNFALISDPSLEIGADRSATFRYTAYLRSGNGPIYEASTNPGTTTFQTFTPIYTDPFTEGPAAIGGNLGADSTHIVFAKGWGSDQLLFTATVPGIQ